MAEQFVKMTMGVDLTQGIDIVQVNRYFSQMAKVIETLSEDGKALSAAMRKSADKIEKDFYVSQNQAENVKKGFEAIRAKAVGVGDYARQHDPLTLTQGQSVEITKYKQMIEGNKREIAQLKAIVSRFGGTMTPAAQQGYYNFELPNAEISPGMTPKKYVSSVARNIRNRIKANKELEKENLGYEHPNGGSGDGGDSGVTPEGDVGGGGGRRKRPAEMLQSLRRVAEIAIIIKLLHQLVDLTKKLFDSMNKLGSQARQASLDSLRLQVSPMDIIKYTRAEVVKGLSEGTVAGALGVVNQKFGSVLTMDTSVFGKLGPVMGESLEALVKNALGRGGTPADVLNLIVGKFLQQADAGLSSTGEKVGRASAVTELANVLQASLGEQFAALFTAQAKDLFSGDSATRAGALQETLGWIMHKREAVVNPRGVTDANVSQLESINSVLKEIKALWEGIKTGILGEIAISLRHMIGGVRNLFRAAMNPEARQRDILAAREDNRIKLREAEQFKENQAKAVESAARSIPESIRPQYLAAVQALGSSGTLPSDADLLSFLDRSPAEREKFLQTAAIVRGVKGVTEFIERIRKNPDDWITGSVAQEFQIFAENFYRTNFNLPEGRSGGSNRATATYNRQRAFGQKVLTELPDFKRAEIANRAADVGLAEHLAREMYRTYSPSRGQPAARGATVVAGEAFVTVQLLDAQGRPIPGASTQVATQMYEKGKTHFVNLANATSNIP